MLQQVVSNPPFEPHSSKTHIIESPRIALRSINANPRTSRHKEVPLITCRMPMDFPEGARLHRHNCGTKLARNREDRRINDFHRSAGGLMVVCFLR